VDSELNFSALASQVLRLLIKLYESVDNPDWVNIAQCLLFLDDAPEVAKMLDKLLKGTEVSAGILCCHFLHALFHNVMVSRVWVAEYCACMQDDALLAYQVCFDLIENESQSFLIKVASLSDP